MHKALRSLIDAVLPPHREVLQSRSIDPAKILEVLSVRQGPEKWITVGFSYSDPNIRTLVRANKYYGEKKSGEKLSILLEEVVMSALEDRALLPEWNQVLLVPIPTSKKRIRKRGYNQVHRIVNPLLKRNVYLSCGPHTLQKRHRETQLAVPLTKRHQNISGAFYVQNKRKVKGKCVMLVDDISETGATMRDARRALLEAGAREVIGVAIAQ